MKAIYKGVVAHITDDNGMGCVLDNELWIDYGDMSLIVDPTDEQLEAAEAGETIPLDYTEANDLVSFGTRHGMPTETIDKALAIWSVERPLAIQRRTT